MNLKKLIIMGCAIVLSVVLVGCSNNKNVEEKLEDLMAKIYEVIPEDERPMMLNNTVVTEENIEYYLGTKDITFKEALASEPMVGSIPHSVVLIRANEGQDIEALKKAVKENVNPAKWICVNVEEENVIVENNGDLVILIMTNEHPQELLEQFKNLK